MKPWLWLTAIMLVAFPVCLCPSGPSVSADVGAKTGVLTPETRLVGAASCSAAACHNGNYAQDKLGSEFTHWMTRDRHAKAYEILFETRALSIQAKLGAAVKAHQDQRCLVCHVHPEYDSTLEQRIPYFKTDGVSCESCHGPARDWLSVHYQDSWQQRSAAEKRAAGMNDTQSTLGRAQVCVKCHVGAAGMEVDHDLIAAGHPRLHFEFSAFHAMMPRHWPDAKDRDPRVHPRGRADFEANAWALGQLATAQASLDLLAHRTGAKHVHWPEFAEFDCAACHHKLVSPSDRRKVGFGKRHPGALPWGRQVAFVPFSLSSEEDAELRAALADLRQLMDRGNTRQAVIHEKATHVAGLLRARLQSFDANAVRATAMLQAYFDKDQNAATTPDEWTQARLGAAALDACGLTLPFAPRLQDFARHAPVQSFDPTSIRRRLERFRSERLDLEPTKR